MDSGESNLGRGGLELKIICCTVWVLYKNSNLEMNDKYKSEA